MAGPNAPRELDEEQPLDPAAERVRRKLLRFMVINLGILFAAVMTVVAALVYRSLTPENDGRAAAPASPGVPSGEMLSGDIRLPAGAEIVSHSASASRLTLLLRLADGSETLLLYDMEERRPVGSFRILRGTE